MGFDRIGDIPGHQMNAPLVSTEMYYDIDRLTAVNNKFPLFPSTEPSGTNSLVTIELHMRHPQSNNKLWQYKHDLGGCLNGSAPAAAMEDLVPVFLNDLKNYSFETYLSPIPDLAVNPLLDRVDKVIELLLGYNSLINVVTNRVHAKMGDLLNEFVLDCHDIHYKVSIREINKRVNELIMEDYRSILRECSCLICCAGK